MACSRSIQSVASIILLTGCAGAGESDADPPPFFSGNLNTGGTQNTGFAGAMPMGNNGGARSNIGGAGQGTQQTGGASNFGSGNGGNGQSGGFNGAGNSGGLGSSGAGNGSGGVPGGAGAPGGGFVSVDVDGGASAAFVCPPGPFGSPLTGMGQVQTINPPAGNFFAFIEGPVWVGSLGKLFFSDQASQPERIFELSAPFTTPAVFIADSGSNGLAVDNQDSLVLADQSDDRVVRVDPVSKAILDNIAPPGNYNPNDLIVRSDDNVYFTSPNDPGRGFYRVAPGGQLSGPFTQANATGNAPNNPNGIVLSPDENTLYVTDVNARFVSSFALLASGELDLQSGQRFVNMTAGNLPDGMAVDCAGNLYVGTSVGVEVYSPDGNSIGVVAQGEASNCTFGGADRRTLFVTSRSVLKSVTLGVPGLPD